MEELAKLFWIVAGYDEAAFKLITAISNLDGRGVRNLVVLIDNAIPSLVFTNPAFAKDILRRLTGEQRQLIVDALAYQASHFRIGSYSGLPGDYIADQQRRFTDNTAAFTDEPGFEDLAPRPPPARVNRWVCYAATVMRCNAATAYLIPGSRG